MPLASKLLAIGVAFQNKNSRSPGGEDKSEGWLLLLGLGTLRAGKTGGACRCGSMTPNLLLTAGNNMLRIRG